MPSNELHQKTAYYAYDDIIGEGLEGSQGLTAKSIISHLPLNVPEQNSFTGAFLWAFFFGASLSASLGVPLGSLGSSSLWNSQSDESAD